MYILAARDKPEIMELTMTGGKSNRQRWLASLKI